MAERREMALIELANRRRLRTLWGGAEFSLAKSDDAPIGSTLQAVVLDFKKS